MTLPARLVLLLASVAMMPAVACLSGCAGTRSGFVGRDVIGQYPYQVITTNMLERASAALDKAGNAQDLEGLLAYLASNVVITVSFPRNPDYPQMVFSKHTYADHLKETWAKTRDVSVQRMTTEYEIAADGQSATATATFRQTATVKDTGQTFTSTGKQVSTVKLIQGMPKATRIAMTVTTAYR